MPGKKRISAVDRSGREYSCDEMRLVFKTFYKKNTAVIAKMLPSISEDAMRKRAKFYGVMEARDYEIYSDCHIAILRDKFPDYAEMERLLPERSARSIRVRCRRLGLRQPHLGDFTPEEDAMLRRGEKPPGRGQQSIYRRHLRLGIDKSSLKKVLALGEEALRERVNSIVPRGLPRHIREEAIQIVHMLCIEGKCSPEDEPLRAACKRAVTATRKMHPDWGAPLSMDAKLFDDGSATVGDRISSDTFHF
ncbi:hypothetical protein [Methylobacterium sp. E-045]|uniref:hypothetical protein n=1 Tax=Methylobacterium sp. E-045 TaxID=2836575 RepID=UPI001FB91EC4|nr:hypothetical protein [Methylobacterium sp. E-045]MCJ2132219.1 hypothetical protein [Methylobacterium sp. E-045]